MNVEMDICLDESDSTALREPVLELVRSLVGFQRTGYRTCSGSAWLSRLWGDSDCGNSDV